MIINEEYFGQIVNGTNKAEQFDVIIGSSNNINAVDDADDTKVSSITINAAAGNDVINVHNGNNNSIDAGNGNDTINIYKGSNNAIYAGNGNDIVNINGGNNNAISTGSGNDTINIHAGSANTIKGGIGNDIFNIWWKPGMELVLDQSDASAKDNDKITIYDVSSTDFTMSIRGNNVLLTNRNGGTITLKNLNIAGLNQVFFAKDSKNYILNTNGSKAKLVGRADANDEVYLMGGSKNTAYTYDGNDLINVNGGSTHTVKAGNGNDSIIINGGSSHKIYGENGNDYIEVNAGGSHQIYGGNDNDTIIINSNGEGMTVKGENGDDKIYVNASNNNKIYGGNGNDYIEIKTNGNKVYGENGDDTIVITGSRNIVDSGKQNDTVILNSGEYNTIKTGDGDDRFELRSGNNNTVDTGKGNDTINSINGSYNNIKTGDGNDAIGAIAGNNNTIDTGKHNDTINSINGSFNTIKTGDGDDVIDTIIGNNNTIDTGKHNDTINSINGSNNNIKTGDGNDVIRTIVGDNNTIDTGKGNDIINSISGSRNNIKTGDGDDKILNFTGNNNLIDTGKGNDTLVLTNGSWNNILMNNGNDVLELRSGNNNVIDTGKNNDTVTLYAGEHNTIKTGDGNDIININSGNNNTIDAGTGNDTIYIKGGSNNVYYTGKGNDTVVINAGTNNQVYTENDKDSVYVNGGTNLINTGASNDYVQLNKGVNTVYGGLGNDTFDVNGGENYVYGEAGNDIFNIKASAFVKGGAGSDTYNVTWNNNLNLTIDQSENGSRDKDVLKILNLNSTDVKFSHNENNDIIITGKNGGQTVITKYGVTIFNYIQFANGVKLNSAQIKAEADKALNMNLSFKASGNSDIYLANNVSEVKLVNTKASNVSYTYDYYQDSMIISNGQGATLTIKNWSTAPSAGFSFVDANKNKADIAALATNKYIFGGNNTQVLGSNKADIFKITGSGNNVNGGAGNDSFEVSGMNNKVMGGAGNDVFNISGSNHEISGGTGSDQYNVNWKLGSTIIINNGEYIRGDVNTLNVLNYAIGAFTKSYDETSGTYTLTDEQGGRLIINGWKNNSLELSFKGEKFTSGELNEMAKPKEEIPEAGTPSLPGLGELDMGKPDNSNKNDLVENVLVICEKNEAIAAPVKITNTINGTAANDVFNIVASKKEAIKVVGGLGKDTYNIDWTNGAHVIIDQTSSTYDIDNDLLNIKGLNFSDASLYYDDNTDTLRISDNFGGSLDIVGWGTNYVYNTSFDDKKLQFDEIYTNMWYGYNPRLDNGSVNIIDKVVVDFECNRDRVFTITTDDRGYAQAIVNMTEVAGIVHYDYNLTKTDFGITLTNNVGTDDETVVTLNLGNISTSGVESLNIGSAKSFYFVKKGIVDFTSKEMSEQNEIIFTGVNTSNLDIPKWKVTVNAGAATLNFNQLQMLAENMVTLDSKGNLVNVKNTPSINCVKSGNDLVLTYNDVYNQKNRKVGEVTLKNFYNNTSVAQYVYMGRGFENEDYNKLRVVVGSELKDTVNMNNYSGNIMYLAGAGNDSIIAKTGSYIVAQDGDDIVTSYGDHVDILAGAGNDTIKLGSATTTAVSYNMVDAGIGDDNINIYGHHNGVRAGEGNDTIVIDRSDYNTVYGEAGNDTITVSGNYNTIYGDDGKDNIVITSGSNNRVYAGNDDDILTLNDGTKNTLYGDSGSDTFRINGGSYNQVYGGEGNDYVEINGGLAQNARCGSGDDYIVINGGSKHYVYGESGNDTIIINKGDSNIVYGGNDNDCIKILGGDKNKAYGDNGNDEIYVYGGTGHAVYGGAGDDIFVVKSAADGITLTGGLGSDIYDVDWTLGHKLVVKNGDYANGDADVLILNQVNASDLSVSYNETTGALLLTDSANGTIKVEDYSKNPLEIKCNGQTLDTTSITKIMWNLNTASYDFAGTGVNYSDLQASDSFGCANQVGYAFGSAQ